MESMPSSGPSRRRGLYQKYLRDASVPVSRQTLWRHRKQGPGKLPLTGRGSIVLDGPNMLQSPEAIQLLQATATCFVTCHVTQLLTCCTYQVTSFLELVVFKETG